MASEAETLLVLIILSIVLKFVDMYFIEVIDQMVR